MAFSWLVQEFGDLERAEKMDNKQWKYKIGSGKMPMIVSSLMLVLFGGLTIWLYRTQNGAFLFTGVLSAAMLLLLAATIHRFLFYKVFIGKDGFYYQTRQKNGRYYEYKEIEKAWVSSGTTQNGAQEEYCNIAVSGGRVIRFQFFYSDKKGVRYLIKRVEAVGGIGKESRLSDSGEYLIDGKVFGNTGIVIAFVLLVIVAVLDFMFIQSDVPVAYYIPGTFVMIGLIVYLFIHQRYFRIQIGEQGFYYRTNPFNGRQYAYHEIAECREIKKVIRHGRKYRGARSRSYYFFFEFTDVYGKTRKFLFEKPVHEREVNVLKERIEKARAETYNYM